MSHAQYLRDLLRPLGVYDLTAPFNGGELDAQGEALDAVCARLEDIQKEASLATAEGWGLEKVASLLTRRPVASQPRKLAAALAAINDTITGCGIPAVVKELGKGRASVSFPGVAGEPDNFQQLKKIIEDILPAHLGVEYRFWFLTWQELEDSFPSWQSVQSLGLSWAQLETFVEFL